MKSPVGIEQLRLAVILAIISILLIYSAPTSYAAQLSRDTGRECSVLLSGEIKPGDFEKLETIAKALKLSDEISDGEANNQLNEALCLDSVGGSYFEGQKISRFVHKFGITTRIPEGARCLSSCAFIFMAGRITGGEFVGPSRFLHINATLGFNSPYPNLKGDDTKYKPKEVENLIAGFGSIISNFMQLGSYSSQSRYRPAISPTLLGELLAYKRDKVMLIDTIEEVERWQISLYGEKISFSLSKRELVQACMNFHNWSFDNKSKAIEGDWWKSGVSKETLSQNETSIVYSKIDISGLAERYCLFEVEDDASSYLKLCTKDGFTGVNFGDCPEYGIIIPKYYGLSPSTKINNLHQ